MNNLLLNLAKRSSIMAKLIPSAGGIGLVAKKYAPEAYLVLGVASGVVAAVMLAKAYKNHDEVLGEALQEVEETRNYVDDPEVVEENSVSDKERSMLLGKSYGKLFAETVKLYGPSVMLAGTSVYLLLTSHGILRGRNKAIFAALQVVESGFSTYRRRVIEAEGKEADERYSYGAYQQTIYETGVDSDGKKVKSSYKQNVLPEVITPMIYSRVFDETNPEHVKDRDMNIFILRAIERAMNDILTIKGVVMLNDVYDELHIPRSREGAIVGWALKARGDNYIDFGLDNLINRNISVNRFILDFNVNGVVFEFLGK